MRFNVLSLRRPATAVAIAAVALTATPGVAGADSGTAAGRTATR